MDVKYNSSYRGAVYATNYGSAYYPSSDGLFHDVYYTNAMNCVLTGYWVQTPGGNVYLQTTQGFWILNGDSSWTKQNMTRTVATWSAADAQSLVNTIIDNDQKILCGNLFCARYANKLTKAERQRLYDLQTRLQERDQELRNGGMVTDIKTSYPQGYADLAMYLDDFMKNPQGVGVVVSTTVVIIVSCVVVASLATAAYFAYKAFAEESKEDVKFSEELTRTLQSRLTDDEYQQLMDETQGIVTKARIKQMFSSDASLIGWVLVGLGVITVVNLWRGGTLRR